MIKLWCIFRCKTCAIDIMATATVYIIEKKYAMIGIECPVCHKDTLYAMSIKELSELFRKYELNKFQPVKMEVDNERPN